MRAKNNCDIVNKDRVITELEKIYSKTRAVELLDVKQDSSLVRAVDSVLQHGLRDPVRGYWSLVRSLTHSTTLKSLEAFVKYISSSQQKGLAWTYYTLEEGSLEFYLTSLLQDCSSLQQHYLDHALLRDCVLADRVVAAITCLRAEAANIQASMESSMTSLDQVTESTPSLISPVDSGVALIDSDTNLSDGDKQEECLGAGGGWTQQPVLGSSVSTQLSCSSDSTLADDCTNSNIPAAKPSSGIIAQNKYDGVCRRRKKKKSESGKRVSFHQDSVDDTDTVRNINKFYVEGRNSWAGEDDSFFTKMDNFRKVKSEIYENKGLSLNISIFESEMGIEADCDGSTSTLDDAKNNIEIVCEKLTNVVKQSLGLKTKEKEVTNINAGFKNQEVQKSYKISSIGEREAPEGQEDPGLFGEYEQVLPPPARVSVDLTSDSEWSLDTADKLCKKQLFKSPGPQKMTASQPNWPARVLHEAPSKTSLVKRFLRSIPVKKPFKPKKQAQKPSLYIKGVKPDLALSHDLLNELNDEMQRNKPPASLGEDEVVTEEMRTALQAHVLVNKSEQIYKVYRVASTEGVPLLAVLTDSALYMTGLGCDNHYSRRHHISYRTLDSVVIGPEYQTVMLVMVDRSVTVTVISALGKALVSHMMTHLCVAVCRAAHTQLSVRLLSLHTMQALYRALLSQSSVTKDETLQYYRYIRVEDSHMSRPYNPLSLCRSGHLMYRSHNHSPWLPGYIVLKGGILYVFSDTNQLSPKHVLSLHPGYFGGCRRVPNSTRPHTFEIMPFSQRGLYGSFQFAAADDYETSDWLQAFIQMSSKVSEREWAREELLAGCGLLLTSRHLLTLDFPDTVLSCARLQDISAIRTATTCCILETSCREVRESGGDWILYFLTEQAISEFLSTLYQLRPELKQAVMTEWECEVLRTHCYRTSQLVCSAWDPLLRPSTLKGH